MNTRFRAECRNGWLVLVPEPAMLRYGIIPHDIWSPMETTLVERKSTHKAEVVPVVLEPHPNADSLSIVKVWGYEVCARTEDWAGIDRAVYVLPDSVVDVRRPEFAFLAQDANADGKARIKAKRLRGVVSYGLLVPAPEGAILGTDLAEQLGVERYEPPEPGASTKEKFVSSGEEEPEPPFDTGPSKYDVDAFERYHEVFTEGEPVVVTEKLDGSNARFAYWGGRYWVKTRNRWVRRVPSYSHITLDSLVEKGVPEDKARDIVERVAMKRPQVNGFWQVLEATPALMEYLQANPGTVVFGEVYGTTNRLKYGLPEGNRFAAFDVYRGGKFLDFPDMHRELFLAGVPMVPHLHEEYTTYPPQVNPAAYSFSLVKRAAEGKTTVQGGNAAVIREGVVVKPLKERWDKRVGRVILKSVSPDFLGMKG